MSRTEPPANLKALNQKIANLSADELEENLVTGWSDFTGVLITDKQARPKGVKAEYVMHPYRVKLRYKGSEMTGAPNFNGSRAR